MAAVQYLLARGANLDLRTKEGKLCADFASYPEMQALFSITPSAVPSIPAKGSTILSGTIPLPSPPLSSLREATSPAPQNIRYEPQQLLSKTPNDVVASPPLVSPPMIKQKPITLPQQQTVVATGTNSNSHSVVLQACIRIKLSREEYFREFPLPASLAELKSMIQLEWLESVDSSITIVRLPNTLVRNDWDVSRLRDCDELQILNN